MSNLKKKWIDSAMATDDELANEAANRQSADTNHTNLIAGLQSSKYDASNPSNFETPTQLNNRDTANRSRANHTGTQLADTISNFFTSVLATVLTGLNLTVASAITATDTVLSALGKLQAQINNLTGIANQVWDISNLTTMETSNTATWVTHSTLVANNLAVGKYRFAFNYVMAIANNSRTAEIRILKNGTEVLLSRTRYGSNNALDMIVGGTFRFFPMLSGNNTFEFQFKVGSAGATTVAIHESLMYLRREGN